MTKILKFLGIISILVGFLAFAPVSKAHEEEPGHTPGGGGDSTHTDDGVISEGPIKGAKLKLIGQGRRPLPEGTTDVWAHKGYAYLGTFSSPCGDGTGDNGSGVRIFDYGNIEDKVVSEVGFIPSVFGSRSNDVKVAQMNSGDILIHSNERCQSGGPGGFEIWNVDDPLQAVHLAHVQTDDTNNYLREILNFRDHGVHNLFLFKQNEKDYVAAVVLSGFGTFQIFDITNPTNPQMVGSWGAEEIRMADLGITQEPELLDDLNAINDLFDWLRFEGSGVFANRRLHDITINEDGTRAYLSNWDAGLVLLDISDLTDPVLISVALEPDNKDGEVNSHSAWPSQDETIVVEGNEDFFTTTTPLNPFDLELPVTLRFEPEDSGNYTVSLASSNYDSDIGDSTGLGLDASVPISFSPGFPYFGTVYPQVFVNTAGTVTLNGGIVQFLPSTHEFIHGPPRIAPWWADLDPSLGGAVHAIDKGDRLVITWNGVPYYESNDGSPSTFQLVLYADGTIEMNYLQIAPLKALTTLIGISEGNNNESGTELDYTEDLPLALAGTILEQFSNIGPSPWGGIRIWDFSDPANPVLASNFDTVCSARPGAEACNPNAIYSVHNIIVEGHKAYISWYGNGVLIIDISDPYNPVELARYHPGDEKFELQNNGIQSVWGIYKIPGESLIFASDRNGGLYILEELGKFKKKK